MPDPIADADLQAISDAIFRGAKVEAIKRYREATGTGLAEAKREVERLTVELKATSPGKFTAAANRSGCVGLLAAGVLLTAVVGAWSVARWS